MFRRERKGLIVVALLVAFAAGPGAAEAAGGEAREGADLWSRLLGWLGAQAAMVTATWGDEGHYIDPNGRPQSTANGDVGPYIDPDGRPQSTADGDEGPYIDPNGRPD
jgi:hypothetical protein